MPCFAIWSGGTVAPMSAFPLFFIGADHEGTGFGDRKIARSCPLLPLEIAGERCSAWARSDVSGRRPWDRFRGCERTVEPCPGGSYMRGWRSYFGFCETPEVLIGLTRWVRLRLRAALWRQWKTPRRRRAALLALRVPPRFARNTAGSGRGPWYLARSQALAMGLQCLFSVARPSLVDREALA
jgi:hypothetical protein